VRRGGNEMSEFLSEYQKSLMGKFPLNYHYTPAPPALSVDQLAWLYLYSNAPLADNVKNNEFANVGLDEFNAKFYPRVEEETR
jgi:hypothetical protein